MIVEFNVSCLGYSVAGYNHSFQIEIEEWELEGKTEGEKEVYIERAIHEHIIENIDFEYKIKK